MFMFICGTFILTVKNKENSTLHLGLGYILFAVFYFGYFLAAAFYHPLAAYHRWITAGIILPTEIHLIQWILRYPNNTNPLLTKIILWTQYLIVIVLVPIFIYITLGTKKVYHFTGHYWDFDAERISYIVSLFIVLFILMVPALAAYKAFKIKSHEKNAIIQFAIFTLIGGIVPSIANANSRDGALDRGTYLNLLVLTLILGFFFNFMVYVNHTKERTTFMSKIVGITVVTFLLVMQGMGFMMMKEREAEYDAIRVEYLERALEGGKRHSDIEYILELSYDTKELKYGDYQIDLNLDLPLVKEDFLNTIIYEEVFRIENQNFKENLKKLLDETHEGFSGYKNVLIAYLNKQSNLDGFELKKELKSFIEKVNITTFVHTNKISKIPEDNFCDNFQNYLRKNDKEKHFSSKIFTHLKDCKWDGKTIDGYTLKKEVLRYFRHFKSALSRHYRKNLADSKHYVAYIKYYPETKSVKEVGFSYIAYREYIHPSSKMQKVILFSALFIILFLVPLFFHGSLVKPLNNLLNGVEKVNKGDLSIKVPIKVHDEIGFLAGSFNSMVSSILHARVQLEDYAENLEEKVKDRTKEVQEKMEEVQKLKTQQDGDYFLTSLLAKPLYFNANKSRDVVTLFYIEQKKKFEFRNRKSELGGDICVTGNLRFGSPDNFEQYTMAVNADAMGKSMQGAGGSLVMGVVVNSIMARSASNRKILEMSPEEWLTKTYTEINSVFKSFSGTMAISATMALINDKTGWMYYFNAEHPFTILYRDGMAAFIEEELMLRKLGLDSEFPFKVQSFKLEKGDVIILGSDGRDDLDLGEQNGIRNINTDEKLILDVVEKGKADLEEMVKVLKTKGNLTDDLSLLRIGFQENAIEQETEKQEKSILLRNVYNETRMLYKEGNIDRALDVLSRVYTSEEGSQKLSKIYGLLSFKGKDFETAIKVLNDYIKKDPDTEEMWYYLSLSYKKMGYYLESLKAGEKAYNLKPDSVRNLVNLSDLYRLNGKIEDAFEYSNKVLELDENNEKAKKLLKLIKRSRDN